MRFASISFHRNRRSSSIAANPRSPETATAISLGLSKGKASPAARMLLKRAEAARVGGRGGLPTVEYQTNANRRTGTKDRSCEIARLVGYEPEAGHSCLYRWSGGGRFGAVVSA
jgi:hypothetical protein